MINKKEFFFFFLICLFIQLYGFGAMNAENLIKSLSEKSEKERANVKQVFLTQQKEYVQALLRIVAKPIVEGEPFFDDSPRNSAIFLLGEMRSPEAVDELVKWVVIKQGQFAKVTETPRSSPAGLALEKIGLPAVPALSEAIKSSKNKYNAIEYGRIVFFIKGKLDSINYFKRILEKTKEENARQNINYVIEFIEKIKE